MRNKKLAEKFRAPCIICGNPGEFKDINGYEGKYMISSCGFILSLYNGCEMSPYTNRGGYYAVKLRKSGVKKGFYVHRLVAEHFVLNINSKPHVNHLDGDKGNNCFSNLEWCTAKENINHAISNGLKTKTPNRKLSNQDIVDMRKRLSAGESVAMIAQDYPVTKQSIYNIKNKRTWDNGQ